jgi:hypothetical protein
MLDKFITQWSQVESSAEDKLLWLWRCAKRIKALSGLTLSLLVVVPADGSGAVAQRHLIAPKSPGSFIQEASGVVLRWEGQAGSQQLFFEVHRSLKQQEESEAQQQKRADGVEAWWGSRLYGSVLHLCKCRGWNG